MTGLTLLDTGATDAPSSLPSAAPTCGGRTATQVGTPGKDVFRGGNVQDVFVGLGGPDIMAGIGGNDFLCGGPGDDKLGSQAGHDRLFGGPGNDKLDAGGGRDRLDGGGGTDICRGQRAGPGPAVRAGLGLTEERDS